MPPDGTHGVETSRASDPRGAPLGRIAFFGFLAIAAILLWTEHRAHVLGALPYVLILLLCPLLHLLHCGHGGHHGGHGGGNGAAPRSSE